MSHNSVESQSIPELQQDLQNELITANQLLQIITVELHKIKEITRPGGEFELNIKQNAALMVNLANMQNIDLKNVPQMKRVNDMDVTQNTNQNMSYEQHDSFRDTMDESQENYA